jgi:hypothetical protein
MKEQNGWGRPVLCQNVKPEHDQLSARIAKNQVTIDRSEGHGADYEQIDRSYCCGLIAQKGFPALRSWSTNPEHISSSVNPEPATAPPRLPAPIGAKPALMPAEQSLRQLDDNDPIEQRKELAV